MLHIPEIVENFIEDYPDYEIEFYTESEANPCLLGYHKDTKRAAYYYELESGMVICCDLLSHTSEPFTTIFEQHIRVQKINVKQVETENDFYEVINFQY